MNWEAIGAIAEMIGGIAVLMTLIYLAIQIRDNSISLRRETARGSLSVASIWRAHIIDNPDLARIFRTGLLDPKGLEPDDRTRFRMLMHSLIELWAFAYVHDGKRLVAQEIFIIDTLSQEGGALAWKGFEHSIDRAFQDYVNGLLKGKRQAG